MPVTGSGCFEEMPLMSIVWQPGTLNGGSAPTAGCPSGAQRQGDRAAAHGVHLIYSLLLSDDWRGCKAPLQAPLPHPGGKVTEL